MLSRMACGVAAAANAANALSSLTNPTSSPMGPPVEAAAAAASPAALTTLESSLLGSCQSDRNCCDMIEDPATAPPLLSVVEVGAGAGAARPVTTETAGAASMDGTRFLVAAGLRPKPMYFAGDGAGAIAGAVAAGALAVAEGALVVGLLSSSEL